MDVRPIGLVVLAAAGCSGDAPPGGGGGDDGGPDARGDGGGDSPDAAVPVGTPYAFVATPSTDAIRVYRVDPDTGALEYATAGVATGPTFLAYDPVHHALYAAEEGGDSVLGFAVSDEGGLTGTGRVAAGDGPVSLTVDRGGKHVLVANYGGGTAAVLPIEGDDGALGEAVDEEDVGANAHHIVLDPTEAFAFVPSLGTDTLVQYLYDGEAGTLTENAVRGVATAADAGPRHLAFAPSGERAFLINELDSTLTALTLDGATGRLTPVQTVSTLPEGEDGPNTTAEVAVHPNGRLVFGSNRGHDSIVAFALDDDGTMTLIGHTAVGAHPRHFSIDPTGRHMYVAGRDDGTVDVLAIDADTGALTRTSGLDGLAGPTFVAVFYR